MREDGKAVSLAEALDDGRPVVLDFIFTTCTTICPVLSQTFTQLQDKLGSQRRQGAPGLDLHRPGAGHARRAWRSTPGGSTPAREWRFYTGTTEASVAVQRAFEVYRGDKMDHTPVTFLRAAPGRRWVRIDGFASADELARELHELVAAR